VASQGSTRGRRSSSSCRPSEACLARERERELPRRLPP
jgi:hypothetical protein